MRGDNMNKLHANRLYTEPSTYPAAIGLNSIDHIGKNLDFRLKFLDEALDLGIVFHGFHVVFVNRHDSYSLHPENLEKIRGSGPDRGKAKGDGDNGHHG